ncbi:MAG TPA: hypothetical protein VLX91_01915 [Candidatus Acidoferrales bacterium]|nr:hypothetical protein [Candidatus Acidoferrales bacterium]
MPIANKRSNVLFIGIDKVVLAAMLGVTPSYVRQILRGIRGSPVQIERMQAIIEDDLRRLRLDSLKSKDLLGDLIPTNRFKKNKDKIMKGEQS